MATNRSGHRPGGGIASKQHVTTPVRTGSGPHSTRPAGVNMLGAMQGDHVTNKGDGTGYRGERLHNPECDFQPVKFGNEVALNVKGGGPGTGRTVYASGSQGCQGTPAQGSPRPNAYRDALENE